MNLSQSDNTTAACFISFEVTQLFKLKERIISLMGTIHNHEGNRQYPITTGFPQMQTQ